MSLSKENLKKIISESDFERLMGEVENDWFECKSQPYQIQSEASKRELAKDISSFANTYGGYILIGVKTKRSTTHFGDEVEKIRPFNQNLVNPTQYQDVIKAWVYPEIENIDIQWVPIKNDKNKGLVIIEIPEQKESVKPFLITKTLDAKKKIEIIFGYSERKGDKSQPSSAEDLQKALRSGFNYENQLREKLNGLEILLRQLLENYSLAISRKTKIKEKIIERIARALRHEGMHQKRALTLTAYPDQESDLKTIFSTTEGSIRKHLENPPTLRRAGWSLETLDQAKIIRGEMIRVVNGDRKVIDLYRDGTLIFAGLANQDFLAWSSSPEKQKINPVAIVELVYSFVNFYKFVLEDFKKKLESISIRVDLRNMHLDGVKNYLVPYKLGSVDQLLETEKKDAPDNNGTIIKSFLIKDFDVGIIAFEVLKEIYLWFGLEENKIPYIKTEGENRMVDPDEIINIR